MKRTVSFHNMHDKSTNQFMGLIKKNSDKHTFCFAILPFDQWCLLMYCSNFFSGGGWVCIKFDYPQLQLSFTIVIGMHAA